MIQQKYHIKIAIYQTYFNKHILQKYYKFMIYYKFINNAKILRLHCCNISHFKVIISKVISNNMFS